MYKLQYANTIGVDSFSIQSIHFHQVSYLIVFYSVYSKGVIFMYIEMPFSEQTPNHKLA